MKIIKNDKLQINIIHVKDDFQCKILQNLPNNLNILNVSNFVTDSMLNRLFSNLSLCLEEINIMMTNDEYNKKYIKLTNIKIPHNCNLSTYCFTNLSDIYNFLLGNELPNNKKYIVISNNNVISN